MLYASKPSKGILVCFPDVCLTPQAAVPMPIPYPNIAKTANEARKKKIYTAKQVISKKSGYTKTDGDEGGVVHGHVAHAHNEMIRIKKELNRINLKLQSMTSEDPNVWQGAIVEFVNTAGALYMTQKASI